MCHVPITLAKKSSFLHQPFPREYQTCPTRLADRALMKSTRKSREEKVMETIHRKHPQLSSPLDLFSSFMFEASGDSEVDFPGDPYVEGPPRYHHHHHRCSRYESSSTDDDDEDDAESCILGSPLSSSDCNLNEVDVPHKEIIEAKKAGDDPRWARDVGEIIVASVDHRRDDNREKSRVSGDSITVDHHPHHGRGRLFIISDDSISSNHVHHQYDKFTRKKEKDKLFWETCLAS